MHRVQVYGATDTWQTWNVRVTASSATTGAIWASWQDHQTTPSWTSASTATWADWNRSYTVTASTNAAIWSDWVTNPIRAYSMGDLQVVARGGVPRRPAPVPLVRSEDDWNSIRARQEAERLNREADAANKAARIEAQRLLKVVLSKAQFAQYRRFNYFDVVGSEGGVYRLHHGTSGNIRQLVDGREVNRLCVHPELRTVGENGSGYLPTEDVLAAQALAIMHDERGSVTLANVHQGQRHLRAVA